MKYSITTILLILLISSCKEAPTPKESIPTITYETALENYLTLKKENPKTYRNLSENCMVGSEIPDFKTKSIDGQVITKEKLKGKVTILNFWFTTCPPCVAEVPGLNKIVEKFGHDNVNYIAIARNKQNEVEEFLTKHPWQFTHISNEDRIVEKGFKIPFGYPTTYLLNKDAQIIKSFSGGAMGERAIAAIQEKLVPAIEKELASE